MLCGSKLDLVSALTLKQGNLFFIQLGLLVEIIQLSWFVV